MKKSFCHYFMEWGMECATKGEDNVDCSQLFMLRQFEKENFGGHGPWVPEYGDKLLELYNTDRMMFLFCMAGYALLLAEIGESKREQYKCSKYDECTKQCYSYIYSDKAFKDVQDAWDAFKDHDIIVIFIDEQTTAAVVCDSMFRENKEAEV